MNDYDLLPVNNFQSGSSPLADRITAQAFPQKTRSQSCADSDRTGMKSLSMPHMADVVGIATESRPLRL
jgi:hypothetical protein